MGDIMASTCRYYEYSGGLFSGGNYCSVTGKRTDLLRFRGIKNCNLKFERMI